MFAEICDILGTKADVVGEIQCHINLSVSYPVDFSHDFQASIQGDARFLRPWKMAMDTIGKSWCSIVLGVHE